MNVWRNRLQTLASPSETAVELRGRQFSSMASQRAVLGAGLAILLLISAASIGLEVKSRADAAWVDRTLFMLPKLSDMRLLIRQAESAARGFALSNDPNFVTEFQVARDRVPAELNELIEASRDNPDQTQLLEGSRPLIERRLAVSTERFRLVDAGDRAGVAALNERKEGRTAMRLISANLDRLTAEEERLLAIRTADSQRTRLALLGVDLAGGVLILLLAGLLIRSHRRSSQELNSSLIASRAENETLEAAVAERTETLLAAHEELRHSASILQSTFNGMAEAVLVIDTKGTVVLSNAAAARMLRYQQGMTVHNLRAMSAVYGADGATPM